MIARNAPAPELLRASPEAPDGLTEAPRTRLDLRDAGDRRMPYAVATLSSYADAAELTVATTSRNPLH